VKTTNEVIFRAPDLGAVKKYYAERLGFPILLETEIVIGFDTGALNLYFERGAWNGAVFEFTAPEIQKRKEELVASGCEVVEENPAVPRIYLRDPFGVVFNINEP
jgi:Glyoxalase-like domain